LVLGSAVVQAFADNDPYVQSGLVKDFAIREWMVVIGAELLDMETNRAEGEANALAPPPTPLEASPLSYNEWFQPSYRAYVGNNPGVSPAMAFKAVAAQWDNAAENPQNKQ
jgi:hypothetical protein